MEKAMHSAHGIGFEVYCNKHELRMKVERRREKEYLKSQRIIAHLDKRMYT
jgi:hypothetical protein